MNVCHSQDGGIQHHSAFLWISEDWPWLDARFVSLNSRVQDHSTAGEDHFDHYRNSRDLRQFAWNLLWGHKAILWGIDKGAHLLCSDWPAGFVVVFYSDIIWKEGKKMTASCCRMLAHGRWNGLFSQRKSSEQGKVILWVQNLGLTSHFLSTIWYELVRLR